MSRKKKTEFLKMYSENGYGMSVRRCCASCVHKALTGKLRYRKCLKHLCQVKAHNVCVDWEMNKPSQKAGASEGKVKRREYLMYVLEVREREHLAEKQGNKVAPMTLEEIRQLFEQEHGTIYVNI